MLRVEFGDSILDSNGVLGGHGVDYIFRFDAEGC